MTKTIVLSSHARSRSLQLISFLEEDRMLTHSIVNKPLAELNALGPYANTDSHIGEQIRVARRQATSRAHFRGSRVFPSAEHRFGVGRAARIGATPPAPAHSSRLLSQPTLGHL